MAENEKNPVVTMSTNMGDIRMELNSDKAPITTKNFLAYVNDGHFDGLIFHRVIPGFMIQGGGFDSKMSQRPTKSPIKNEAHNGLKNVKGSIAMAQFFINVKDNDFLDHKNNSPGGYGYAVFGEVIEGMDIVHTIEKVKTGNRGMHQDVPVDAVVINSVKVEI